MCAHVDTCVRTRGHVCDCWLRCKGSVCVCVCVCVFVVARGGDEEHTGTI